MKLVAEVFNRLDNWRNLPKYGIERRTDIFFSVYLKTVLESKYDLKVKEEIIPEFPIHKGILEPTVKGNPSFNVDFLAFSEGHKTAFLVELKTDISSRRVKQDEYLIAAANKGFAKIMQGLIEIFRASKMKRKYFHLLKLLENTGVIDIPSDLRVKVFSKNLSGIMTIVRKMTIMPVEQVKVVYVQPTGQGEDIITFKEFGNRIDEFRDPITRRFIESLKTWSEVKAGDINA